MWVEQAKIRHGADGGPAMVGSGRFRRVDSESDIVLAQWGTGRWIFQLLDGTHLLADYPTEQDARAALVRALPVYVFGEQDAEPTPDAEPATKTTAARKRASSS